jgi:hypothetical protein
MGLKILDTIGIFIPTLYRPQNINRVITSIIDSMDWKVDYAVYLICPEDDEKTQEELNKHKWKAKVEWWTDSDDMRYVKRIQEMYRCTNEDWFLTGSDDLVFQPGWLEASIEYWDTHSVIGFDDKCNPSLPGTNFLVKRDYIRKFSGVIDEPNTVFHQGYFHNFCDNELTATAMSRNAFVKCDGIIEHHHPTVGKAEWDGVYDMAQDQFHNDAAIFNSRRRLWE